MRWAYALAYLNANTFNPNERKVPNDFPIATEAAFAAMSKLIPLTPISIMVNHFLVPK